MTADLINAGVVGGATALLVIAATIRQHAKRRKGGRG